MGGGMRAEPRAVSGAAFAFSLPVLDADELA